MRLRMFLVFFAVMMALQYLVGPIIVAPLVCKAVIGEDCEAK